MQHAKYFLLDESFALPATLIARITLLCAYVQYMQPYG